MKKEEKSYLMKIQQRSIVEKLIVILLG